MERVFKGNPEDALKFSYMGGQVGDTVEYFEWNDVIQEDARLIVFLAKAENDSPAHRVDTGGLFPEFHLLVKDNVARGPVAEIPMGELVEQLK